MTTAVARTLGRYSLALDAQLDALRDSHSRGELTGFQPGDSAMPCGSIWR